MTEMLTGLHAVKTKVKSLASLAHKLGITRGAIYQWHEVPSRRVGEVARLTGLSPEVIRPDIFGIGADHHGSEE